MTDYTDVLRQQRARLDLLQAYTKKPLLVKAREGGTSKDANANPRLYSWMLYKDIFHEINEPIYTRGILPNELCFDPDIKNWDVLTAELKKISEYLHKEEIPFEMAYSGGHGIHIHVFFNPELKIDVDNFDNCKIYDIDLYKIVRNVLVDIILNGSGTNRLTLALDPKKISFSKDRKGSQIREYGTTRPDGGYKTLITTIPEERPAPGSLPLIFPERIQIWTVPQKYNQEINDRIRAEIQKAIEYNEFNTESIDLRGSKLDHFPCVKTLLKNGTVTGNRYYGASSIALIGKKCGLSWKATEEYIQRFFENCDITAEEAILRTNNCKPFYETGHWNFSCSVVKEVFGRGICDFGNCVLCEKTKDIQQQAEAAEKEKSVSQHIKDEADRILNSGDPVKYIVNTAQTMHLGDEKTAESIVVAIGEQSVKNVGGLQPKVSGDSGKGKTHCCDVVIHLVPSEWKRTASHSDNAVFYAEYPAGCVVYSDDVNPSEQMQDVIKQSTSHFQAGFKKVIVDDLKKRILTIPPRMVWLLTSVDDDVSVQVLNRQFNVGVDESSEMDNKVAAFQRKQAKNAEPELLENTTLRRAGK